MNSGEYIQIAASSIVIISTVPNGCLEGSLKIDSSSYYNFRSSHWKQFWEIRVPDIIKKKKKKKREIIEIQVMSSIATILKELIFSKAAGP